NETLRKIYDERRKAGDRRLFYVPSRGLHGGDGQGTVDGVHPTDLGFMRMADGIEPVLKKALRAAR
ncbi:MAG: SGNH/GDSL hydrolase family protein, partial [Verrucomicrobiota bacterium]